MSKMVSKAMFLSRNAATENNACIWAVHKFKIRHRQDKKLGIHAPLDLLQIQASMSLLLSNS